MNRWFGCLLGMTVVCSAQGQVRAPANPLQTLPRTEAPKQAPVKVNVEAPTQAMEALLASHLTPTRFDVTGVRSIPFAKVAAEFAPMRGKDTSVRELIAAADRVTAMYKQAGYALSFAFVPNQSFAGGVVHIAVVEGYVSEVSVTGDTGNMDSRVRAIASHVVGERPLRQETFERYTQLLGQLPGLTVGANVPPPTTTDGATKLELVAKRQRYDVNYGMDFNHPGAQGVFTLLENGATPLGEQLSLSTLFPNGGGQRLYSLGYMEPFGSEGWQGKIDATRYWGSPDTDNQLPAYLDHRLTQDRLALSTVYPIVLTNTRRLSLTMGIYASRQDDRYRNTDNGAMVALQSSIRVLNAELAWLQAGTQRTGQFSIAAAHGFAGMGAYSRAVSNNGPLAISTPDVSFTRYTMNFAWSEQWKHKFGTVVRGTGQYSDNALPSTEQINFGGPSYAYAYDPGDAAGDSGWAASAEVNRGFVSGTKWIKSVVPYLVYQTARVYLNGSRPLIDKLDSAAVGVRVSDNKHYSLDFALARPTGDRPPESDDRETRWNLTFSYKLM
ncbi:MAG: ShlB/FhaC/HecB family hemolysin secretion/activation protein [Luteibacter sp.]|uniref:ShlB/FhaC/HecB family hemolysin secretion/activation protein n=1 Tax=unclassified Luteibacter TaxID=2620188 RepID=UPI0018CF9979|nr:MULTISPECIES: ShlB/FhaC/HecB family hemolysin secretion/activation protein [unclassified Luteibacter]MDQ7995175.1 ShlB/FhaC/HecB family hemolysin secretion/activation protein [Luteibacter sp.]MDR6644161.1 hemolysin activation/secretion protein [Luteibacter sp. 1214]